MSKIRVKVSYLSKYESADVIIKRAVQLSAGVPPYIEIVQGEQFDPVKIAQEEFEKGLLDFEIKRYKPVDPDRYEVWHKDELTIG